MSQEEISPSDKPQHDPSLDRTESTNSYNTELDNDEEDNVVADIDDDKNFELCNEISQLNEAVDKYLPEDHEDLLGKVRSLLNQQQIRNLYKHLRTLNSFIIKEDPNFIPLENDTNNGIKYIDQETLKSLTKFQLGEQVQIMEDHAIEFKFFLYPFKKHYEEIRQAICSFLNHQGGRLYIGIKNSGEVAGISLTRKQKDSISLLIEQWLDTSFSPRVPNGSVTSYFIQVEDEQGKPIAGRYVLKIVVKQGEPDRVYCYDPVAKVALRRKGMAKDITATDLFGTILKRCQAHIPEPTSDMFNDVQPPIFEDCYKVEFQLDKKTTKEDLSNFIKEIDYKTKNNRSVEDLFSYFNETQTIYKKFTSQNEAEEYAKNMNEKLSTVGNKICKKVWIV